MYDDTLNKNTKQEMKELDDIAKTIPAGDANENINNNRKN